MDANGCWRCSWFAKSVSPEERLHHLEGHYTDRVTAFRQRLAKLGPDRVLISLLDIGKNGHSLPGHV